MSDERAQRARELLLTRIALYGYTMVEVFGKAEPGPSYTYTLGLPRELGHPELVGLL